MLLQRTYACYFAVVLMMFSAVMLPNSAVANADEWVNIHINQIQLSNTDTWETDSEVKIYIVTHFGDSAEYLSVLTYPHQGTISATPDAYGNTQIRINHAGLSLAVPAHVGSVVVEVTAVDVDQLSFNDPRLTAVIDNVLGKLPGALATFTVKNKKLLTKLFGHVIGAAGSIAYDYIAEEDTLGTVSIHLSRQNGWIPTNYPTASSRNMQVWYEIRTAAAKGNSSSGTEPPNNNTSASVNTAKLNLRTGPGTGHSIITSLPAGTVVKVIVQQNGWTQIRLSSGVTGWVSSKYLQFRPVTTSDVKSPTPDVSSTAEMTRQKLEETIRTSSVSNSYPWEARKFGTNLVMHLNEFELSGEGITSESLQTALHRPDSGDRINALVNRVWDDWRQYGVDHMLANPAEHGQSPFRQLVIRLIQARQGRLSVQDQRALYSFLTRNEQEWSDNSIRGVIGAVNRDFYG